MLWLDNITNIKPLYIVFHKIQRDGKMFAEAMLEYRQK